MKSGTLYISVEKPELDLFGLRFNNRVEGIIKKIKTINDVIVDCWAVDMTSGFVDKERRDIAIIASLHDVKSVENVRGITNLVLKIENVIKVKYDIGDSLIH